MAARRHRAREGGLAADGTGGGQAPCAGRRQHGATSRPPPGRHRRPRHAAPARAGRVSSSSIGASVVRAASAPRGKGQGRAARQHRLGHAARPILNGAEAQARRDDARPSRTQARGSRPGHRLRPAGRTRGSRSGSPGRQGHAPPHQPLLRRKPRQQGEGLRGRAGRVTRQAGRLQAGAAAQPATSLSTRWPRNRDVPTPRRARNCPSSTG